MPRNPQNPIYGRIADYVDHGLGGFLAETDWAASAATELGKMKVPTLRNVDMRPSPGDVKAYMHNGAFKSLEEVVHFSTRAMHCRVAPTRRRARNGAAAAGRHPKSRRT